MAEMSPQMRNQFAQYQQLQQQIQMIATQKFQIEAKISEVDRALEELKKAGDVPVYRSIGSILVKAESKEEVEKDLDEQKETLQVRVKTLERQETHLRERYQGLQEQLTKALKTEEKEDA